MDWALCALRPPYGPRNDREIVWILGSARSGRVEDQILPHIRANVRMVSSKKPLNPDSKAHEGYLGRQAVRDPEPLAPLGFRASLDVCRGRADRAGAEHLPAGEGAA